MRQEDKERAEVLADEHWEWFQKVVGHVAKDFFTHGYKHGADAIREKCREKNDSKE